MTERNDLGEFLRACRANVNVEDVGLAPGRGSRRVPGLRRQEVAQLAGLSVDYYTRLEQGRHSTPSIDVVDAIARALQLDDAARAHLNDLAKPVRRRASNPQAQRVRQAVAQLLESLADLPAFVLGRRTDVLASNALARALITDWGALPARERNMTRWTLLDPLARDLYDDWETVAADVVGTLRLDAGKHPDDPILNELVGELTIKSPEFRLWWDRHRVAERTHGTKHMRHPSVGPITIQYEALTLPGDPDQTLFIYTTEPGSTSQENLRLLASWTSPSAARPARRRSSAEPRND